MTPPPPSTANPKVKTVYALQGGTAGGFQARADAFLHEWTRLSGGVATKIHADGANGWHESKVSPTVFLLKGLHSLYLTIISTSVVLPERLLQLAGRTVVFVCTEPSTREIIREAPGSSAWVVLNLDDVAEIFLAASLPESRELFLSAVRLQVPRRTLIPFQTTKAVVGSMFQGRRLELDDLFYSDETSFALVGPSRIGKTSLARQFIRHLNAKRDQRAGRAYFVNFQNLPLKTDDAMAQEIAMQVYHPAADRMTSSKMWDFLRSHAHRLGGPLQLVLDECDEVCHNWLFNQLCEWARLSDAPCRLLTMGKTHLARKVLMGGGDAISRLEVMRPGPLSESEAWKLFREPLCQLGLGFQDEGGMRKELWRRTSGLPHLIQSLGKNIVEFCCKQDRDGIEVRSLNAACAEFLSLARLRGHLLEMTCPRAQIAALVTLLRDDENAATAWTARRLFAELSHHRVVESIDECMDLLDELTLHNFLIWENSTYQPGRWDFRHIAQQHRSDLAQLLQEKLRQVRAKGAA